MKSYECVVIGGGPAGMTAALYLLRSGVSTALVEKLSPGGQVLMTSEIENYPGFPDGVKGYELADIFAKHLESFDLDRYNDEVASMEPGDKVHRLTVGGETIEAATVILCTGAQYRQLGVPGEEKYGGKGVSYCALCDGNFFRGQEVAVVGGGDSALEESLYLAKICSKVHIIHRRDDFRGAKCIQDKCFVDPAINVIRSAVVEEITGTDAGVDGVNLKNVKTGETSRLDVSGVFIFIGFTPVGDFIHEKIDKDHMGFVVTDTEMRTSVPGIFAAGDIRSKLCRQVVTATGDGATAAHAAFLYLQEHA